MKAATAASEASLHSAIAARAHCHDHFLSADNIECGRTDPKTQECRVACTTYLDASHDVRRLVRYDTERAENLLVRNRLDKRAAAGAERVCGPSAAKAGETAASASS